MCILRRISERVGLLGSIINERCFCRGNLNRKRTDRPGDLLCRDITSAVCRPAVICAVVERDLNGILPRIFASQDPVCNVDEFAFLRGDILNPHQRGVKSAERDGVVCVCLVCISPIGKGGNGDALFLNGHRKDKGIPSAVLPGEVIIVERDSNGIRACIHRRQRAALRIDQRKRRTSRSRRECERIGKRTAHTRLTCDNRVVIGKSPCLRLRIVDIRSIGQSRLDNFQRNDLKRGFINRLLPSFPLRIVFLIGFDRKRDLERSHIRQGERTVCRRNVTVFLVRCPQFRTFGKEIGGELRLSVVDGIRKGREFEFPLSDLEIDVRGLIADKIRCLCN